MVWNTCYGNGGAGYPGTEPPDCSVCDDRRRVRVRNSTDEDDGTEPCPACGDESPVSEETNDV